MRLPTIVCFVLSSTAIANGAPVEFAVGPVIARDGTHVSIRFEMSAGTDVEVAILDAKGQVVRHLAAGVLGGKSPPPKPLAPGLSQRLVWDGLDDYGQPVTDVEGGSIRVRAGMGSRLDRIVGGNPYAYYSKEMGQGDHAAWRITGLEAKSDGKVYVLGNADNYGPPALRQFDARGNYLRTVYPPPAGKDIDAVKGWGIVERPDGTYSFQYGDLSSPALSLTPIAGTRGRIATLIPFPERDRLLLESDHRLMTIHTDGTIDPNPMLPDRLVNEPAMEPADESTWQLTGPMQSVLSPDGRSMYLGGLFAGAYDRRSRIGAEPTGFWRDGQIFKVDLATRKANVFFALPESDVLTDLKTRGESPIADARYGTYAALQGVAVDAQGRVFVCDRLHERVLVLDQTGKTIRELPLSFPDAVAVSPNSTALYVTTRRGHFGETGELNLVKYDDWSKDDAPAERIPLCDVRQYAQPTHLAAVESAGEVFVWIAYTTLPVRVYRDSGSKLELVKDFDEAGSQRALDLQHIAVDRTTNHVYVPDGFNHCFRITDWNDPKFELCMEDEQTPLRALSVTIDSRHRHLFAHTSKSPVARYRLDGRFLSPAPVTDAAGSHNLTPDMTDDWRIGLGHSDRGIAVAPDGSLVTLAALGGGPDYAGYLRYFKTDSTRAPWQGLYFEKLGRFRAAGARFDPQGNLYVGWAEDRGVEHPLAPPPGFENDRNFRESTGRIRKYAPTGSLKSGDLFPTEPDGPTKSYDIHYGVIGNHFSRTPRFGVDGYGRIHYPTSLLPQVSVIDNAGNAIHSFGTYGNRDSMGGLPGDLVPTEGIPMAWPSSVDATDDYIYVSDIVDIRLLRIAKTFAAESTIGIP